jgi:hypothetical protein
MCGIRREIHIDCSTEALHNVGLLMKECPVLTSTASDNAVCFRHVPQNEPALRTLQVHILPMERARTVRLYSRHQAHSG